MKTRIGAPDDLPPGIRRVSYGIFCWFNRHLGVWRLIGAAMRGWPFIASWLGFAARAHSVKQVLTRPQSFSNTSHAANLLAGEFLIGMDPGPTYDADKQLFDTRLKTLNAAADASAEAEGRLVNLRQARSFDLIDDYLMWVVYRAVEPAFGFAAESIAAGSHSFRCTEGLEHRYMMELRYVAAQLFAGTLAPIDVQRRAEACAASLRARIQAMTPAIGLAWPSSSTQPFSMVQRNAVGLAWVSHPVTVQSGALIFEELLTRPKEYALLRERAAALGGQAWTDTRFRNEVEHHVLELMRFRPIFPLLAREVPRDTEFETGGRRNARCPSGSKVTVLSIAALFDPAAVENSGAYFPHRDWGNEKDLRYLMFGYGTRQCPAKDHAVEMLTSALIGLLTLPPLQLEEPVAYDGPLMSRMRLRVR